MDGNIMKILSNGTFEGLRNCSYDIASNSTIVYIDNNVYPLFYNYQANGLDEMRWILDFKDICTKNESNCSVIPTKKGYIVNFTSDKDIDPTFQNISGCTTLDQNNTYYTLNASVSNHVGNCMVFTSVNSTLDGNGYIIDGDDSAIDSGIYGLNNNNLTIINFANVTGFYYGVSLSTVTKSYINNMTLKNNSLGIQLAGSNNNTVTNVIANNGYTGIMVSQSSNCTITNITANSNSFSGLTSQLNSNNTFTNITANSNLNGIYLSLVTGNIIKNSNMSNNSQYNFFFDGSTNSHFNNNIDTSNTIDSSFKIYYNYSASNYVYNNSDTGLVICGKCNNITVKNVNLSHYSRQSIILFNTTNSTIQNVTASNSQYGVFSYYSTNINITSSRAYSNSEYGLLLQYSRNNTLRSNNMSNNKYNFYLLALSNLDYNHDIDTTNIVDYSYKIYYNISVSNYVYNNPDAGTVMCIRCNNITVKDINLSHYNQYGLFLYNTTNSRVQNITLSNNYNGYNDFYSVNNNLSWITSVDNKNYGVVINTGGSSNRYTNMNISRNINGGFYLPSCSDSILTNITANYNRNLGLTIVGSRNVLNNIVTSFNNNSGYGLTVNGAFNNITGVIANSNSARGILIQGGDNNTAINLTTLSNTASGVMIVSNSHNNTIINATAGYSAIGVYVQGNNNTFVNMTSQSNLFYGLYVEICSDNSFNGVASGSLSDVYCETPEPNYDNGLTYTTNYGCNFIISWLSCDMSYCYADCSQNPTLHSPKTFDYPLILNNVGSFRLGATITFTSTRLLKVMPECKLIIDANAKLTW
jgi:parallel beta-helix repeat protein